MRKAEDLRDGRGGRMVREMADFMLTEVQRLSKVIALAGVTANT